MEPQEIKEPSSETELTAMIDLDTPAKTNLMEMSPEELAKVSRNLLKIWREIDERKPN